MISKLIKREFKILLTSIFIIFLITSISVILLESVESCINSIFRGFLKSIYFMIIIYFIHNTSIMNNNAIRSMKYSLLNNGLKTLKIMNLSFIIIFFIMICIFFYFDPSLSLKLVTIILLTIIQCSNNVLSLYLKVFKVIKKEKNYNTLLNRFHR